MTPEQLKMALSKPTPAPKPVKKGLLAKMRAPKANQNQPQHLTRFQLKKRKENEEKRDLNK